MTSILNVPATYAIAHRFDDITMRAKFVVLRDGKWIGAFVTEKEAKDFAKLHYSLHSE